MKIAVVGAIDYPISKNTLGGSEMWTYNYVEALIEHGVDVTLFASSGSKTNAKNVAVCDHNDLLEMKTGELSKAKYNLYCINQIVEVLKREDEFDLIHLSVFPFYLYLPVVKLFKKPVVITIHGYNRIGKADATDILTKFSEPNYVYVSTSFAKNWPRPEKLSVILNGIDTSDFEFSNTTGDYYLWIGRICEQKGIVDAINFAQKLNAKLIIAGPIGDKVLFEKSVSPNLNDSIKYVGEVNFNQKVPLYQNAKALLFPLKSVEPLPLVVLESLACGTPILSYKIDPMTELVKDGLNGFLVEPDDVEALATQSEKVAKIDRKSCRDYVQKNFNFDQMVQAYLDLYKNILEKQKCQK